MLDEKFETRNIEEMALNDDVSVQTGSMLAKWTRIKIRKAIALLRQVTYPVFALLKIQRIVTQLSLAVCQCMRLEIVIIGKAKDAYVNDHYDSSNQDFWYGNIT